MGGMAEGAEGMSEEEQIYGRQPGQADQPPGPRDAYPDAEAFEDQWGEEVMQGEEVRQRTGAGSGVQGHKARHGVQGREGWT